LSFLQEFITVDKKDQVANVMKLSYSTSGKCVIWLILKNDSHQIRIATGKKDDPNVSNPSSNSRSSDFTNINTTSIPVQNTNVSHPSVIRNTTANVFRHSAVNVLDPLRTNPSEKDHEIDSSLR
jgi:hypothetical protein